MTLLVLCMYTGKYAYCITVTETRILRDPQNTAEEGNWTSAKYIYIHYTQFDIRAWQLLSDAPRGTSSSSVVYISQHPITAACSQHLDVIVVDCIVGLRLHFCCVIGDVIGCRWKTGHGWRNRVRWFGERGPRTNDKEARCQERAERVTQGEIRHSAETLKVACTRECVLWPSASEPNFDFLIIHCSGSAMHSIPVTLVISMIVFFSQAN